MGQPCSILAINNGAPVGSIVLKLTGTLTHTQTESVAPYVLYGDNAGNYNPPPSPFTEGNYTITATPYSASGGNGTAGVPLSVNFSIFSGGNNCSSLTLNKTTVSATCDNADGSATVTASGGASPYTYLWDAAAGLQTTATASGLSAGVYTVTVTDANGCVKTENVTISETGCGPLSLALVNTTTDQILMPLSNGATIDLNTYNGAALSILAINNGAPVGSIVLKLTGTLTHTQAESVAPYVLYGDNPTGNYNPPTTPFVEGNYTITATPYSAAGGKGTAGIPLIVNFELIKTNTVGRNFISEEQVASTFDALQVKALFPNPMLDDELTIEFNQSVEMDMEYIVYDQIGHIFNFGQLTVNGSKVKIRFREGELRRGTYILRLQGEKLETQTLTIVKD
ncbi:MAG: hypothetical protein HC913_24155 [Microscillaceae bacterium]|nr:hypothetical protein [Microscillaceae bacterium]